MEKDSSFLDEAQITLEIPEYIHQQLHLRSQELGMEPSTLIRKLLLLDLENEN